MLKRIKNWLRHFSFRTGIWVLTACLVFYALAFLQVFLPISTEAKSILGIVLLGMAKTTQYAGFFIVGPEGYRRVKAKLLHRKKKKETTAAEPELRAESEQEAV